MITVGGRMIIISFPAVRYENKIVYRLFMENHPVFNENHMAEVTQDVG